MRYTRAGKEVDISVSTVRRVKAMMLEDPHHHLLLQNADERKEYMRTYAGEVFAAHANDLWEMDMTRCDVCVLWPDTGEIARPRVHAIIDVYSGCIPSLVFSREEDQKQTDLCIVRALRPKTGLYTEKYPVYGIPKRIYWDNGKTYTSGQAENVLARLGIQNLHSKPKVSHTRGKIERFFRSLHGHEKILPGYVGENAAKRATEEIKRLTKNTNRWLERDLKDDPGEGERLLTINEYQSLVLAWLMVDYHTKMVVDGKSRLEHFVETAPPDSLALVDVDELFLAIAQRFERTVEPGGTIRLENQRWTIPDGSLIEYQGRKVLVLKDQFTWGGTLLIAYETRYGKLNIIGDATPAPTIAGSLEAGELRRQSRAKAQAAQREAKQQKRDLADPELRITRQLMKEAMVTVEPTLPPVKQARLAAVNPPEPDLGDWAIDLHEEVDIYSMTPDEILKASKGR